MSRRNFTHGAAAALLARGNLRAGPRRVALPGVGRRRHTGGQLAAGERAVASPRPSSGPRRHQDVVIHGCGQHSRSLEAVAPDVAAQWHATKNGATTPADATAGSDAKCWFTCDALAGPDHEWESALRSGCAYAYICKRQLGFGKAGCSMARVGFCIKHSVSDSVPRVCVCVRRVS